MTPRPLLGVIFAAALALSGCPGDGAASAPTPPAPAPRPAPAAKPQKSGEELFKATCSACHGPDARGVPKLGKDLVTSEYARTQTDEQLAALIHEGRGPDHPLNTTQVAMPPKGGNPALKDEEILRIIAHLRALQQTVKQ